MNSISIIEFLLVSAIVVTQTTLALRTHKQIKVLGLIIPTLNFFKLKKYNIPIEDLQEFQPKEILFSPTSQCALSCAHCDVKKNKTILTILDCIYLENSKGIKH